jgi:hypothetical protein
VGHYAGLEKSFQSAASFRNLGQAQIGETGGARVGLDGNWPEGIKRPRIGCNGFRTKQLKAAHRHHRKTWKTSPEQKLQTGYTVPVLSHPKCLTLLGGRTRARTWDRLIKSHMLSQENQRPFRQMCR